MCFRTGRNKPSLAISCSALTLALFAACSGATPESGVTPTTPPAADVCGDVVGAWSGVTSGLRARLITSGSRADHSALRVSLELENVSGQGPLEIHWSGRPNLGYASFGLDDATGVEVPAPDWAFGGNESTGDIWELVPATGSLRHDVAPNVFDEFSGRRVLRVGTFWAREMPTDGSHVLLRATLAGRAPLEADTALVDGVARTASPDDPRGRAWIGTLEVPPVCVD